MKNEFSLKSNQKIIWIEITLILLISISFKAHAQAQDALFSYLSEQIGLPRYTYHLKAVYPHDSQAFTQGLVYDKGILYESTGLFGESSLRKVDLNTGEILRLIQISDTHFAEGLTLFGRILIQLTWKSNLVFQYDQDTLELQKTSSYPYDGWGITDDGNELIVSDGSEVIRFLDPNDFSLLRKIQAHAGDRVIDRLNELEYIHGKIYSNVWYTDLILIIEPKNGEVTGWIDLKGLEEKSDLSNRILNGIAYDPEHNRLFITGKNWHHVYEIQLIEEKTCDS